jgi:hypothetical protein
MKLINCFYKTVTLLSALSPVTAFCWKPASSQPSYPTQKYSSTSVTISYYDCGNSNLYISPGVVNGNVMTFVGNDTGGLQDLCANPRTTATQLNTHPEIKMYSTSKNGFYNPTTSISQASTSGFTFASSPTGNQNRSCQITWTYIPGPQGGTGWNALQQSGTCPSWLEGQITGALQTQKPPNS